MAVGNYQHRLQTSPRITTESSLYIHALFCYCGAENTVDPDVKKLHFWFYFWKWVKRVFKMVDGRRISAGNGTPPTILFFAISFQPTSFILMRSAATDYQIGGSWKRSPGEPGWWRGMTFTFGQVKVIKPRLTSDHQSPLYHWGKAITHQVPWSWNSFFVFLNKKKSTLGLLLFTSSLIAFTFHSPFTRMLRHTYYNMFTFYLRTTSGSYFGSTNSREFVLLFWVGWHKVRWANKTALSATENG